MALLSANIIQDFLRTFVLRRYKELKFYATTTIQQSIRNFYAIDHGTLSTITKKIYPSPSLINAAATIQRLVRHFTPFQFQILLSISEMIQEFEANLDIFLLSFYNLKSKFYNKIPASPISSNKIGEIILIESYNMNKSLLINMI